MDPSKQYKLIIKNKRGHENERIVPGCNGQSNVPTKIESSDNDTSTPLPKILQVPNETIKSKGCSTLLQCEIEQIIKGLLTIEIELDNEEYECIIQEKSCQSSCPVPLPASFKPVNSKPYSKPPPVMTFPPPPLTEGEIGLPLTLSPPPALPPKPYHNNNLIWRQSLPVMETVNPPRCNRVAFTPSPSLGRRMSKPMLRSKMELMAEVGDFNRDIRPYATIHREQPIYDSCEYLEIVKDEDVNDSLVKQMLTPNICGMPTEESDRIAYRTQSSESITGVQQTRANVSVTEKKKKKFSCV